jgi:hypothetical protein
LKGIVTAAAEIVFDLFLCWFAHIAMFLNAGFVPKRVASCGRGNEGNEAEFET